MEQQLQRIERSIDDATREAYEAMVKSRGTIVGNIFADKENNVNNKNDEEGITEGMSNRAGMEMGLALFGTSDAYKTQMEEEFQEKLSTVERELDGIREGLLSLGEMENKNGSADQDVDSDLDGGNKNHNAPEQFELSIDEIPHLQHHVQFLQQCAQAKTLLDDVEKMSFSNFATSSVDAVESTGNPNTSPDFLLSPGVQISFRSSGGEDEDGKSPMVKAAHLIKEVDSILDSASLKLKGNAAPNQLNKLRAKIFNELQTEACRYRSELKFRATTLIEKCIVFEEDKMIVMGSTSAAKQSKSPSSFLSDAFDVLNSFCFGETLDVAMKNLAHKITDVLKLRMATFESALANGEVAMYTMREETAKKPRRNAGSVMETSMQLIWTSSTVKYGEESEDDERDTIFNADSAEINESVLKSAPSVAAATLISLLNYMTNLFTFIHDHVLLGRADLAKILGKHIFKPALPDFELSAGGEGIFMKDLVDTVRGWCIPQSSSPQVWNEVQRAEQRLIEETGAFDDGMMKLNLLNGPVSPLSKLTNCLCQSYVSAQRCQVINTARKILLNSDYHNTSRVGQMIKDQSEPGTLESLDDDPHSAFLFEECSVSAVAQEIMQLCRKTLDEAADHDAAANFDSLPPSLYRASREVLDLFRAIVPTRSGKETARFAAVLHNDCVYFAHEACFLGAEYKEKFSKLVSTEGSTKMRLLSESCTFADLVPPFRDLACKSMGTMIEMQKVELCELVSSSLAVPFLNALGSNESVSEWDDAETALRAALRQLLRISQTWKKVLSRSVYCIAMGNLIDTVFVLFLDPLLKATEISDPASRFVHYLLLEATRSSAELFRTDEGNENEEELFSTAAKYANEFDKMQAIGQFMIMRLDDIQRGLEEGTFRCVKAKELSHLLMATFDESEKRRYLLNSLPSK